MPQTVSEILQDRGKSYGSYDAKTAFVQQLKDSMRQQPSWTTMHDGGREALDMIATKIGRLLHGDPRHEDSWVDIGGYADLAAHGDIQDREMVEEFEAVGEILRDMANPVKQPRPIVHEICGGDPLCGGCRVEDKMNDPH